MSGQFCTIFGTFSLFRLQVGCVPWLKTVLLSPLTVVGTRSSPVAFHRSTRERCCRLAGFATKDGFSQVAPDRAEWLLSFQVKLGVYRVFMHDCWPLDGDCCRCRLCPSGPVSAYLPGTGGTLITKDVLPGRGLSIALRFG